MVRPSSEISGLRPEIRSASRRPVPAALQGAKTLSPWLQSGDTLRIDMKGRDGLSLCGAIEQSVVTER